MRTGNLHDMVVDCNVRFLRGKYSLTTISCWQACFPTPTAFSLMWSGEAVVVASATGVAVAMAMAARAVAEAEAVGGGGGGSGVKRRGRWRWWWQWRWRGGGGGDDCKGADGQRIAKDCA